MTKYSSLRLFTIFKVIVLMMALIVVVPSSATNSQSLDKNVTITITGTLVEVEGVECPRMIFLDNYHLVGDLQGFGPGDLVTVTGARDIATTCQQGIPLRVISIR
jgi:hypothetical protein